MEKETITGQTIPVRITSHNYNRKMFRNKYRTSDFNLVKIPLDEAVKLEYVPKIMLSNVMSLVPKVDEVHEFIHRNQISLVFITETWLEASIPDSVVNIPGFSKIRRDRINKSHGGVCAYVNNSDVTYKQILEISCCQEHEIPLDLLVFHASFHVLS